jgi:DNA-binding FrmR family transcriptional regulator
MPRSSLPSLAKCGCGTSDEGVLGGGMLRDDVTLADGGDAVGADGEPGVATARHAVAVDPAIKQRNLARLRRIEGQVRGLQKMVDEERWCVDVLTQVASVQEALRGVSRELLRNHLRHCTAAAVQAGEAEADTVTDELVALLFKYAR